MFRKSCVNKSTIFFRHYQELEKGKWVKVTGWVDRSSPLKLIVDRIARHG